MGEKATNRKYITYYGYVTSNFAVDVSWGLDWFGPSKTVHFEYLLDKVRHALEGWEARLLSFGGNMTLIY